MTEQIIKIPTNECGTVTVVELLEILQDPLNDPTRTEKFRQSYLKLVGEKLDAEYPHQSTSFIYVLASLYDLFMSGQLNISEHIATSAKRLGYVLQVNATMRITRQYYELLGMQALTLYLPEE